jgi:hypothetical protein
MAARNPRNKIALDSLSFGKDFRSGPDWVRMLPIIQRELNLAFCGVKNPRAAIEAAAEEIQSSIETPPDQSQ